MYAVPLRCRQWSCLSCARRLKRHLLRRLERSAPNLFITLTTSPLTAPDATAAYYRANEAVSSLIKRWRRKFPNDPVEYFLVWERTKAGWPHAHMLLKAPKVAKRWLSQNWRELTGSYIVDIQQVSSMQHAARYLAKYLAKDPQVPPGQRRWRRSAKFFTKEPAKPFGDMPKGTFWRREPYPIASLKYLWLKRGLQPFTNGHGLTQAIPDRDAADAVINSPYFTRLEAEVARTSPGLLPESTRTGGG